MRGRPFIALEFIDGMSITDYALLNDLPHREIVALLAKICRAVGYAHQNGVIHRDLNPSNILVDERGEPHVLDFGLAMDAWGGDGDGRFTQTGHVVGTLPYLSPEQAAGCSPHTDVRSDVYALGAVLYELLTGRCPHVVKGDAAAVRSEILSAEPMPLRRACRSHTPERLSDLSAITHDLEAVVHKALAKDRDARYRSADSLADDLDHYLAGDAVAAKMSNRFYLLRKTLRRYRVFAAAAALIVVVLAVATSLIALALAHARAERDHARAVARVAHDTLDEVITEIEEAVHPLAGGIEVRSRLLGNAAVNLAHLAPLVEADAGLVDLHAALREKLGDIAYLQGLHGEAAQHYQAVLEMVESAGGVDRSDSAELVRLLRVHRKLASVAEDAEAHYERALDLAGVVQAWHPEAPGGRYEACRTHVDYGVYLFEVGRHEAGARHADAAIELAESAGTSDASQPWPDVLARAFSLRVDVAVKLGQGDLARELAEKALALRRTASRDRPEDVRIRHKLLLACTALGMLERDAGRSERAAALFSEAIEIGDYLATVDPSGAQWQRSLYCAHDCLARLHLKCGRLEDAQAEAGVAIGLAKQQIASEPDNADWRRLLGFSHMLAGSVTAAEAHWSSARANFIQARDVREALCASDPENVELKAELTVTYGWLGQCNRKLGEADEALAYYQKARRIRQVLWEAQPDVVDRAVDVILADTKLATWHLDRKTPEDDATAARILAQAEEALLALKSENRLTAWEDKCAYWLAGIRKNQALIAKRTRRRAQDGQEPPTTQPSERPPTNP